MKLVAFLLIGFMAMSCGTKMNAKKDGKKNDGNMITATIASEEMVQQSDALTINSVVVTGNIMKIEVTYSGGCQEHSFSVIGSPMIAKSLPPIRSIQLVHSANGDTCRELKTTKIEVNIEALAYKQEEGSEIYLTLAGWKDRVLYKYDTGADK